MNNGLIFNPYIGFQEYQSNLKNYEKLLNKLDRLEKNIRILENRINILEQKEPKTILNDEPTDKYMI